jgi:undecaprenyl diphosphate synthase
MIINRYFTIIALILIAGTSVFYFIHHTTPLTTIRPINHLAIIMDGNRRWAKKHALQPWIGHERGVKPVKEAITFCLEQKIPYLTLYAFSLENFNRPAQELSFLFNVLAQQIASQELQMIFDQGVKVIFSGDETKFPDTVRPVIAQVTEKTKNNTQLTLTILFCYGGQQELVAASKAIAQEIKNGSLKPQDITETTIHDHLWTAHLPTPDLIVRTGGEKRLSNFLTFHAGYSEIFFIDTYWPDITHQDLENMVKEFHQRNRRFGA